MARKNISGKLEKEKAEAGSGFDSPGALLVKKIAKVIAIAAITAAIVGIVVYVFVGNSEAPIVEGGQRNCILSVMGNPPDCSDNDGTLKATYANGKYVGMCYGLDMDGRCIK